MGEGALLAEGAVIRSSGTGVDVGTGSAVLENSVVVGTRLPPSTRRQCPRGRSGTTSCPSRRPAGRPNDDGASRRSGRCRDERGRTRLPRRPARLLDRMAQIRISEAHHGPAGARRYQYIPTYILRGLTRLHLEFTPQGQGPGDAAGDPGLRGD